MEKELDKSEASIEGATEQVKPEDNSTTGNKNKKRKTAGTKDNRLRHTMFFQFCVDQTVGKLPTKKIRRAIAEHVDKEGIKQLTFEEMGILSKGLILYPEAMAYLFFIEGCPRRLFFFLLMFHVDKDTGEVRFNASVILEFIDFCKLFDTVYEEDSVKQAMKDLREKNVFLNVKRGLDIINPMIAGGNSEKGRISLISEYGFKLLQDKKDVIFDFYPRYGN